MEQQIHFCTTHDGVRIAYATVGEGPPLVKAANWLNHLEFDWRSPIWRHWLQEFSRDHLLLRYDERGNGLSDWNVDNLTFEAFVQDLEAVVEAVGLDRFPILGISQGGPVAIAYAARHPEKVSHLILYGSYARGFAKRQPSAEEIERREAELTLVKLGWGQDNPAFRQLWTTLFLPDATTEEWNSFNDLHRVSTSPENAVRFLNEFANIDVVDLLPQVNVPTLVMHCRDESTVPFEEGRLLAAMIPGARFVQLEGKNHLLLEGEPAWTTFVNEVRSFLGSAPATTREVQTRGAGSVDPLSQPDLPNRYSILSSLGAGGMGEVYLAEDTRLGRRIALKTLPMQFTNDKERLRRFQQEARAASALNHPNILTIHEIGVESGAHFIATEFVDGETLRAKLNRGRMKLDEALEVAQQTAFALTAAHGAGIVHRDIKPENIMVRHDGIVKVLDFGLAKLLEGGSREAIDPEADTRALVQTEPGKVMGTPAYMSPEQARGLELDARTDIWSLGVVLYEMLAGRAPFRGETNSHTVVSILESEPPPLATLAPDTPTELQRIVRKALTKDRDSRYQTARDLMIDLKNLRRELDIKSEMQTSTASSVDSHNTNQEKPDTAAATSLGERQSSSDGAPRDGSIGYRVGAFFVMLVIAVGALAIWYYLHRQQAQDVIDSVVVLPFINASNDPNAEYLSDGIAESLMNNLSQLPNLKVISRNSAFQYKGKDQNAQKVGKDLSVRAVVTGTVKQLGDQIVISVSLDDAWDSQHIWGEQYNRSLADILAVQEDIAREISDKLRLKLSGEEKKYLTRRYTKNVEAYQLYLRGRYHGARYTPEGLNKAIEYFNQAITIDRDYALAYAGLAGVYTLSAFAQSAPQQALAKARDASTSALRIDPALAEAHTSLAGIRMYYDWDWSGAEREFKQALELKPGDAAAHNNYGWYLGLMGRFDQGLKELQRARQLDPLSTTTSTAIGWVFLWSHQYDRAIEELRKVIDLDPNFEPAHSVLGETYVQKGQFVEAIEEFQKGMQLGGPIEESLLAHAYGLSGRRAEALKKLDELKRPSGQKYVPPYNIAVIYASLGDKDQALVWLEKAYSERSVWLPWLKVDPKFDSLRSDQRFADLMGRIGL